MFAFSFVALLSIVPAFSLAQSCARSYTVKGGDFCDSISAGNKVSTYQLAALNSDINPACSNLGVGQQLCLGTVGDDCQETYVVKDGDICNAVMAQFKVNATILWANNPQINEACTNMYVGEVLCVASSVQVPPAPAGGVTIDHNAPPAPASTAAPPSQTSAIPVSNPESPPDNDDDDDEDSDCEDEDDEPESTVAPPPKTTAAPPPATTTAPPPAATSAPSDNSGDDGDDEDLPFCDELDD